MWYSSPFQPPRPRGPVFRRWLTVVVCIAGVCGSGYSAEEPGWSWLALTPPNLSAAGGGGVPVSSFGEALDGSVLLLTTKENGLWRSEDGGRNWKLTSRGYPARGATVVTVDPRDPQVMLVLAADGPREREFLGLWRSEDGGRNWKSVLRVRHGEIPDGRDCVAFQGKDNHGIRAVFASLPAGTGLTDGLMMSDNQGRTWTRVNTGFGGTRLTGQPDGTRFWSSGDQGLFASDDNGRTFVRQVPGDVRGMAVCRSKSNFVAACTVDAVFTNAKLGDGEWTKQPAANLPTNRPWHSIRMSTVDPQVLSVAVGEYGASERWLSRDGGKTFVRPQIAADLAVNLFPPMLMGEDLGFIAGAPDSSGAPGKPAMLWSTGGRLLRSEDDGATWMPSAAGFSGPPTAASETQPLAGRWFFDHLNLDRQVLPLATGLAVTVDGGTNWRWVAPSVPGSTSATRMAGATAMGEQTYIAGLLTPGEPLALAVSQDQGATWQREASAYPSPIPGAEVAAADSREPGVGYWARQRSGNVANANAWRPMDGCDVVLTVDCDPNGPGTMYGIRYPGAVVASADQGRTWRTVCEAKLQGPDQQVADLALDWQSRRLWWVVQPARQLWSLDLKEKDAQPRRRDGDRPPWGTPFPTDRSKDRGVDTVAVDPVDPSVVYIGSRGQNGMLGTIGVRRSTDRGQTFISLMPPEADRAEDMRGPWEPRWLRVHPKTRLLYVATDGYGWWTFPAP
jgi:photosystem II stability/assembly factor-like uncharacterized protein